MRDREDQILSHLRANGFSTPEQLAKLLNVSSITIRRDLVDLEKMGQLRRVHGGAIPKESFTAQHIKFRLSRQAAEKRAIAAHAVKLIQPGETLFLDAGSSCYFLAELLPENCQLVVISHSLDTLNALTGKQGIRIISLGGEFNAEVNAFLGPITEQQLETIHVDRAFLGTSGLDPELGSVNDTVEQSRIKTLMCKNSRDRYILADSSKFGIRAFYRTFPTNLISNVITDRAVDVAHIRALKAKSIRVHIAGKGVAK
jgi:DeoR/GlpR family transcriptional regulator of sugar metabolism